MASPPASRRRPPAGAALAFVLGALALAAPRARAAGEAPACGTPTHPWVQIVVAPGAWDASAVRELLRHMQAELAAQQIDVCEAHVSGQKPLAFVQLTPNAAASNVDIAIDVRDALTSKRVGRNVDLTSIPPDGRALTIALAADELLRASWAELAFTGAARPRAEVEIPPSVTETVAGAMRAPPRYPRARLSLGPAAAHWSGGQDHAGGELAVALELSPRVSAGLAAGFLWARPRQSLDGEIEAFAILAAADGSFTVTRPDARGGLDLTLRLGVERVTFVPAPSAGATGQTASGLAVVAAAGPTGWLALRPSVRAFLSARGGLPLRPVRAWDRDQVVTSLSGAGILLQAGVTTTF